MHPTKIDRPRPALSECLWLHIPVLPCPQHPDGLPGFCLIESFTQSRVVADHYLVSAHLGADGQLAGWRFSKGTVEGDVHYDLDLEYGRPCCDCPDSQFRKRPCKHCKALDRMPPPIQLPTHRSAAEQAEHIVFYPILNAIGEPMEPPDRAA